MSLPRKRTKPKAPDEDLTVSAKAKPKTKPRKEKKEIEWELSGAEDAGPSGDNGSKLEVEFVLSLPHKEVELTSSATPAGMLNLHGNLSRQSPMSLKSSKPYFCLQVGMLQQPKVVGSPRLSTTG